MNNQFNKWLIATAFVALVLYAGYNQWAVTTLKQKLSQSQLQAEQAMVAAQNLQEQASKEAARSVEAASRALELQMELEKKLAECQNK